MAAGEDGALLSGRAGYRYRYRYRAGGMLPAPAPAPGTGGATSSGRCCYCCGQPGSGVEASVEGRVGLRVEG